MSKMKQLDEIAQSVADIMLELTNENVEWLIAEEPVDGDNFYKLKKKVTHLAIEKMYNKIKK